MKSLSKAAAAYVGAAGAILKSNYRRLSRPYKLTLALTYRCNFRCRSCLNWQRDPAGEMTLAEITRFFRRQDYFSWVHLAGGEITMLPELPEITAAIADYSPGLTLLNFPTNGYLTAKVIAAVKSVTGRPGLRLVVTVSLDGPPVVHDRLKGRRGAWEQALDTYTALRGEEGVEVFLGMTLQDDNIRLLRETIASVRKRVPEFEIDDLHFNLAHDSFYYGVPDLDPIPASAVASFLEEIPGDARLLAGPRRFLEQRYIRGVREYLESGFCPLPCQALSASCFIEPDWQLYPCIGYERALGNLREVDFDLDRIWNSPESSGLREEIARGICPHCWTPCEAYQTILGNLFRRWLPGSAGRGARRYAPRINPVPPGENQNYD